MGIKVVKAHTGTHRYPNRHHHRPALQHRAPPHPRPNRGPSPPGSGNVRRGAPTGHDTQRTGAPSGITPHQPGRRRGWQRHHLPVAQPPARAGARTRHAPPPRRAPHSPRARKAHPSRRPWRKATPVGQRNRRTMKPSRLHCQHNRNAGSPRWAQKTCGGPRNGH